MRALLSILLLTTAHLLVGQRPTAMFTENKGQWPEHVLYRALFPGGALFVEKKGLTYLLVKGGMNDHHGEADHAHEPFVAHVFKVKFEGALGGVGEGGLRQSHYENFFKGSDPASWGSHCGVFGEVWVHDVYPGIDLHFDGRSGLKYEFIVDAGVDASMIAMRYEGQDDVDLRDGRLHVRTSAGDVLEQAPRSFITFFDGIDNKRVFTKSSFRLRDDVVSFNVTAPTGTGLIIDPQLTFGSYSGSAANNFGFTATYDHDGALYGGGIAFGFGYPVTAGVQQDQFAGGDIDIGVSKWLPDGSALEWSTYIGGTQNETPHSLVVNSNNELFVLAATGSADYPTTPG
ncbi:MAG TPA: hypothetical protein PK760_06975, partial [Flavobacteriales bacterium]|nr:hypothetical protein [Flavobacteriales bacterium]